MKQLILVRHAKSSWSDFKVTDFDRPLNERGKHDAPMMAQRLIDKKIGIDAFVSSPAKRARKTAEFFVKAYGFDKKSILFIEELYLAEPPTFFKVIQGFDDQFETIALFSHNNGITDFANQLTTTRIDEIPTCGVFAVRSGISHWSEFGPEENELWFADFPKAGE